MFILSFQPEGDKSEEFSYATQAMELANQAEVVVSELASKALTKQFKLILVVYPLFFLASSRNSILRN